MRAHGRRSARVLDRSLTSLRIPRLEPGSLPAGSPDHSTPVQGFLHLHRSLFLMPSPDAEVRTPDYSAQSLPPENPTWRREHTGTLGMTGHRGENIQRLRPVSGLLNRYVPGHLGELGTCIKVRTRSRNSSLFCTCPQSSLQELVRRAPGFSSWLSGWILTRLLLRAGLVELLTRSAKRTIDCRPD